MIIQINFYIGLSQQLLIQISITLKTDGVWIGNIL